MLAFAGLLTVSMILIAIMSKRVSPLVSLISIPCVMALLIGSGLDIGGFIAQGIVKVAPVAVMFIFAILFFGIMNDAGMFEPIVGRIISAVGNDPRRILVGTVVLTACVHLDGSGATTFLIAIPALRPLYDKLGMDRRLLACMVAMAAGVCNILPWGGPTLRAAAALDISVIALYRPLIPVQIVGFLFVLLTAYYLGGRERKRLASPLISASQANEKNPLSETGSGSRAGQPLRFYLNIGLTLTVVGLMISALLPPAVAFMLGVVMALLINFSQVDKQHECINAHAQTALMMSSILFAAGAFTGILSGSGMLDAMARSGADIVPASMATHMPILLGVVSMPLSFVFDPDSFYFGVLPVLSGIAGESGVAAAHVAQGALLGQMSTGFPVSPLTPATFLLVGLAGVKLGDHQRFAIPWLFATSLVMTLAGVLFGVFGV